jgi:hypothetical protein
MICDPPFFPKFVTIFKFFTNLLAYIPSETQEVQSQSVPARDTASKSAYSLPIHHV